jgi:hypothetical protein
MINDLWYKNAIVYCLSVSAYMDANGDGIGDFRGLMNRLDYLQGLGVTAIWLMPFQPSHLGRGAVSAKIKEGHQLRQWLKTGGSSFSTERDSGLEPPHESRPSHDPVELYSQTSSQEV